jgi:signal transduction histidine kinase/CheY-like chemotaxis protein
VLSIKRGIPQPFADAAVENQYRTETQEISVRYMRFGGVALVLSAIFFYSHAVTTTGSYFSLRQFGRISQVILGILFIWLGSGKFKRINQNFPIISACFGAITYFSLIFVWGWRDLEHHESVRYGLFTVLLLFLTASVFRIPPKLNFCYVALILTIWYFRGYFTVNPATYWMPNFVYVGLAGIGSLAIAIATENRERSLFWQRLEAQRARDAADAANRSKSYLLAAASHDLRQPLTAMALWSERLQEPRSLPMVGSIASEMRQSVDTLRNMLDALLDLSKLDAGVIPIRLEPVSVNAVLQEIQREYVDRAAAAKLSLVIKCEAEIWIRSDPIHLLRIVRNLVHNAITYTTGGSVTLAARTIVNGRVEISVTDTGLGISEDDQPLIFDEYFQIDNPNRDRSKGLGLGLSIVRRLAELLAHKISLQSAIGQGSRFIITAEAAQPSESISTLPQVPKRSRLDGLRILLVEDDRIVRQALSWSLKDLGAEVAFAETLQEARAAARAGYRLVVCDYRLGRDHTGLEVLEILDREFTLLTGLILTGEADIRAIPSLAEAPYPVLSKPPSLEELSSILLAMQEELETH